MPERFPAPSREAELLVACARTRMDAAQRERVEVLLRSTLDWNALVLSGGLHGMLPLLFWHTSRRTPTWVPDQYRQQLREAYEHTTRKNLWLTRELIKLVSVAKQNGIPLLCHKGPTLASEAYGSLSLRPSIDLDLIVLPRDLSRLRHLLSTLGYQPAWNLTTAQQTLVDHYTGEYRVLSPDANYLVEIHWDIVAKMHQVPFDLEQIFARARCMPLAGSDLLTLAPRDLLLTLVVHGGKHAWTKLKWVIDVAELIRVHEDLDWDGLLAEARALRIERLLHLGLWLAHAGVGAALPSEVCMRLKRDPTAGRIAQKIWTGLLFNERGASTRPFGTTLYVQAREHPTDKIAVLAHWLIVPRVTAHDAWAPFPWYWAPLYPLYAISLSARDYLFNRKSLQRLGQ